ncbi:MAG: hypothetical protein EPO52_13975 [Herbiconiux sp.]|nr:MAG: hypothetical protein EPO52_13975 [Herbiconiux sp.]
MRSWRSRRWPRCCDERLDLAPRVPCRRGHRRLAGGGRIVSDAGAPEWWTLADPEGNEVDLAPWRDSSPWKA